VTTTEHGASRVPVPLAELVLVRHGESVGNLAAVAAGEKGLARLELEYRDPDTPLSDTGVAQADALGGHVAGLPRDRWPEVVLGSPYVRATSTMEHVLRALPAAPRPVLDERVRERDLGLFDGMTGQGIRDTYPEEAARREAMGKFYYRPPGGESWTDVVLRVRSVLGDVRTTHAGRRVWVFTHQAVIMAFRYLLESLTEEELLRIDGSTPLANCSLTTYRPTDGGDLRLVTYGDVEHLETSEVEPTHEEPHGLGRVTTGGDRP
jgi:broad specificity phosphatase PhoE